MPAAPPLRVLCYFEEPGGVGATGGGKTDSLTVSLADVVDVGGQGSGYMWVTARVEGLTVCSAYPEARLPVCQINLMSSVADKLIIVFPLGGAGTQRRGRDLEAAARRQSPMLLKSHGFSTPPHQLARVKIPVDATLGYFERCRDKLVMFYEFVCKDVAVGGTTISGKI
ncbi:hypothetical protein E2C01_050860 [Portunus trituberculatus]|uniref:Uncharacterized protein n=1 Tax=Portunus trituberculatus TaxID=210409 RepID=A0A5B7GK36_PORTR|nr:hypothetical protein [Portunus trituberculatus]